MIREVFFFLICILSPGVIAKEQLGTILTYGSMI